jgi:hypothetical protein
LLTLEGITLWLSLEREPDQDLKAQMLGGNAPMSRPDPAAAPDPDYAALRATALDLARDTHRYVARARATAGPPDADHPEIADLLGRIDRIEGRAAELRLEDLRRWAQGLRQQVETIGSAGR